MKSHFFIGTMVLLLLTNTFSGCGGGGSNVTETTLKPGQAKTYKVGGVSFTMRYVPSDSFSSDDNTITDDITKMTNNLPTDITVPEAYWMGETEVTYELWSIIKNWAKDYTFLDGNGHIGSSNTGSIRQPVTTVDWWEAMIWCNALTEYYYGSSVNCVYYSDPDYQTPIRSVYDSKVNAPYIKATLAGNTDMANCTTKGFRLPISNEWQLAARYQNGTTWTPGDHVSGDTGSYCYPLDEGTSTEFGDYTWFGGNSDIEGGTSFSTQPVGGKTPNALSLYDMSGNVMEWCFDRHPNDTSRLCRGGSWHDLPTYLQIGLVLRGSAGTAVGTVGFRLAKAK